MCSYAFYTLDPELWSRDHVRSWLMWAGKEYNLPELEPARLAEMDGRALGKMGREDLGRLTTPYIGEVLYSHLNFLRSQSKFNRRLHFLSYNYVKV